MSVSAVHILHVLQKNDLKIFRTADVMTLTGLQPSSATHALQRLTKQHLLIKVKRGLWLSEPTQDISAHELLPFLTTPWPAYVSLYSALSQYSVVEEVPHIIYGVTSGRPGKIQTLFGSFHLHHLPDRLMWGYETKRTLHGFVPIAEPEKAFLDLAYLALIPRSGLEMPHKRGRKWKLDAKKLWICAKKFKFKPLENFLKKNMRPHIFVSQ